MTIYSVCRVYKFNYYKFVQHISKRYASAVIRPTSSEWKTVVGLEVHAQITSKTKLFSGSMTNFGALVNDSVSLFDAAIPGTLPVLNRRCVEAAVLIGLALDCKINQVSMFDRKHYFYADLPAGYQITQQRAPIAEDGKLQFQVFDPINKNTYKKTSRIKQIQLEQDSGKSLHDVESDKSLVDLNRAGMPLVELVFDPDLEDGEEAALLVKELTLILTRLRCCSCRMEEGALRVDANVSVHLPGESQGTRTEIKNIGSIRGVASAIKYEATRQVHIKESGGDVVNQTMMWDPQSKMTLPMRDKEIQQDYRYMPEPNLPPLVLNMTDKRNPDMVSVPFLKQQIPELPAQTRARLIRDKGISDASAVQIVNEDTLLQYFEEITAATGRKPNIVANVLINELLAVLNKRRVEISHCKLSSDTLGELCDLLQSNFVNLVTTRKVLDFMLNGSSHSPKEIVEANKWTLINDQVEITKLCEKVLKENEEIVALYRKGNKKVFGALMGALAKESVDKANMSTVARVLTKMLNEPQST